MIGSQHTMSGDGRAIGHPDNHVTRIAADGRVMYRLGANTFSPCCRLALLALYPYPLLATDSASSGQWAETAQRS